MSCPSPRWKIPLNKMTIGHGLSGAKPESASKLGESFSMLQIKTKFLLSQRFDRCAQYISDQRKQLMIQNSNN